MKGEEDKMERMIGIVKNFVRWWRLLDVLADNVI